MLKKKMVNFLTLPLSKAGLTSREYNQSEQHTVPTLRPLAVTILKFLILSLNLCFVSKLQWDNGACK